MASIAPLAAARPAVPGLAERADAALMNVTDADRLRCGAAACRIRTWAKNFPSNAVCRSFSSRVTSGPIATAPGLTVAEERGHRLGVGGVQSPGLHRMADASRRRVQ